MLEWIDKTKEVILSLVLFSIGALIFFCSGIITVSICVLLFFSFCSYFEQRNSVLNREDWLVILALSSIAVSGFLGLVVNDEPLSSFDLKLRYLIAAWILYYISRYNLKAEALFLGGMVGAISAGLFALHDFYLEGNSRATVQGFSAIQFGNIAIISALICLAGLNYFYNQSNSRLLVVLSITGFILGVLASLLSGSRGGWVGMPILVLALISIFKNKISTEKLVGSIFIFIVVVALIVIMPHTNVKNRIHQAANDIEQYEQGNSSTSIGFRLEMWKSGLIAFSQKPVFGWGEKGFHVKQVDIIDEHQLNQDILQFNHLHNQYLEELAKRGLIGFGALLFFMFLMLRLFYKKVNSQNNKVRSLAIAGVLMVIALMDFCLTDAMLRFTDVTMYFVFSITLYWVAIRSAERLENGISLSESHSMYEEKIKKECL